MELCHSVTEFFHDEVKDALKVKHVEAAESTEFYLVNLLVEFASAPIDEEPLALKMAAAAHAAPDERLRTLKEVGDTSLYMSGFFADALARKLVDVDYYISVGGSAYGQLARMLDAGRKTGHVFRDVYGELAGKFPRFVDVLGEIRSRATFAPTGNLIRLYEEWLRTGNDALEKRLRAAGVLVDAGGGEVH
jgi:hypothetical protein